MAHKLIVASLAALSLAACDNQARHGDAKLCTPFPGQPTGQAGANGGPAPTVPQPADAAAAMDDCLHRWGYALAAGPDPADQVAGAAVAACSSVLARWNQQAVTPMPGPTGEAAGGAVEAPSLLTGETTTAAAEHYAFAQRRALFYVVQGRAGKCAAPALPRADSANP